MARSTSTICPVVIHGSEAATGESPGIEFMAYFTTAESGKHERQENQ
jgi:hypothetical protein